MYLKLAWRNIWRKKWRSLITLGSIAFAVFFAVLMRSMQLGMYDKMIDNVVRFWSGYAQIHAKGYQDEQTLDNSMVWDETLMQKASETKHVQAAIPRLEGFALGSSGQLTKGTLVVGSDFPLEEKMLDLAGKVVSGNIPGPDDKGVLIGTGLAEYFQLEAGDTLILLGQGYHGASAAGKYPVTGVAKFSSIQLNDNLVMLPLKEAQWFYGAENRVTSISLMVESQGQTPGVVKALRSQLDEGQYEVLDWKEMMPELVQTIQADSVGGQIMLFILYMVITFGMFGTVLMMTAERKYEFGVLVSIGMRRLKIAFTLFLETILMSVVGALMGGLLALPIVYYVAAHPIPLSGQSAQAMEKFGFEAVIVPSTDPNIMLTHGFIIVVIALFISLYPAWNVKRLEAVKAMRR
ncbi:MAG: ABC transporter permease [Bacteroidia bacterium]|nr:ABC transporter permease [Bacteroidia bacterium]